MGEPPIKEENGMDYVPYDAKCLKAIGEITLELVYLSSGEHDRTQFDKMMNVISATGVHCIASAEMLEHIQQAMANPSLMRMILLAQSQMLFHFKTLGDEETHLDGYIGVVKNLIVNFSTLISTEGFLINPNVAMSMSLNAKDVKEILDFNPFIAVLYILHITGAWTNFFINTRGTPGNPLSIEAEEQS